MPLKNHFRHQRYHAEPPSAPYEVLPSPQAIKPAAVEYQEQLAAACEPIGSANLAAVYLVHGTFVGNDMLGMYTELQRFSPTISEWLRRMSKGMVNAIVGETGNYTPQFAAALREGLSAGMGREIPVHLFNWSSQNNHIGRADGAIRLIVQLAQLSEGFSDKELASPTPPRVMLWGHSHGGNVLALVTNLLAADQAAREVFFNAAKVFYIPWLREKSDMPVWQRVERLLENDHPVKRLPLDIVSFGVPIRYGWDSGGYVKLLHIVNHRPSPSLPDYQTRHPLWPFHLFRATHGDHMHQIGIAGTNMIPFPWAVRTLIADRRLHDILQRDISWMQLLARYSNGQRVPEEGLTLLVDYDDAGWFVHRHLVGHAAYTRRKWLPFHVTEIAQRFYAAATAL